MTTTIKLKNGTGVPTAGALVQGEPAFDLTNKRLYTENAGGTVIEVGTNPSTLSVTGVFGAGSDLQIYHDGSNSYIKDLGAGNLNIQTNGVGVVIADTSASDLAVFNAGNGQVTLYNSGSLKLATTATGIDVTGTVTASNSLVITGGITDHGANRATFSQEGAGGTFIQSYGANTSTMGAYVFRQASSDFSLNATPLTISATGAATFGGNITKSVAPAANGGIVVNDGTNDLIALGSGGFSANGGLATDGGIRTAANFVIATGAGSPERLRIDASGNVGIGVVPTSAYKMQVNVATNTVSTGSPVDSSLVHIAGGTTTVGDGVSLQLTNISGAKETGWRISAVTTSGNNGDLVFNAYAGGADYPERMRLNASGNIVLPTAASYILLGGSNTAVNAYIQESSNSIILGNSNTPRMTVDASGNLLVGHTAQVLDSKVLSQFIGSTHNGIILNETADTANTTFAAFSVSGTAIGSVGRVGATSAVAYNTTSDERLKSNIANSDPVLEKIMQVQVRQYDWTEGNLHQDYGFIAQELAPVLSGIVTEGKEEADMWQLDYSRLTPALLKAIQEQQAIIESLTARIEALEGAK
jgi:hypothetical protein